MNNLKVGMKVIQVENPSRLPKIDKPRMNCPVIKPRTIYEVKAVCYCSQCGSQKIDIGLAPPSESKRMECSDCKNVYPANGRWFLAAINFRPVQYQNISCEIAETFKITEEKSDVQPLIKKEQHEQA